MLLLRFNAPLVFFNAPYFKRGVLAAAEAAGPSLKWLALDMLPINMIDATGLYTAREVASTLRDRGVVLAAAGRHTEWSQWGRAHRVQQESPRIQLYSTLLHVVDTYAQSESAKVAQT